MKQFIHDWDFKNVVAGFLSRFFHTKEGLTPHTSFSLPNLILNLPLLVFVLLVVTALFLARLYLRLKRSVKEASILLELTPPSFTEKSSYTTSQLFSVIHGLGKQKGRLNKLLGKKPRFSFEIVSTRHEGIRYLIRTAPDQINNLKRNLLSYMPQVSIKTVNEYLSENSDNVANFGSKIVEYKLSKSFGYPLEKQGGLKEHDPIAYLTGMMTQLDAGELISFQLIVSPTKTKETGVMADKIRTGEIFEYLEEHSTPLVLKALKFLIIDSVVAIVKWVGSAGATFVQEAQTDAQGVRSLRAYEIQSQLRESTYKMYKPQREYSTFEKEIINTIQDKIREPVFDSSIRLFVLLKEGQDLEERTDGFSSSLRGFDSPMNQMLTRKGALDYKGRLKAFMFKNRLLSIKLPRKDKFAQILSVSEVSDLFHFPYSRTTQTENIVKSYSNELPAPTSLKQDKEFDVTFGKNTYGGVETIIGLTEAERARHMVIFGGTGNGKTTLIQEMIIQDMENGKGFCFIDPHGDAAERMLQMVPKNREKDVVWIDPYDIDFPFAINLMELTPNLSKNDTLREKERVAESIVSLFRRVCSTEFGRAGNNAFRIENTLLNAVYTAFYVKDCTLFTIYDLLEDPKFLREVLAKVDDKRLKTFWKNEFGRAGDYQIVKMIGGVTARIGKFLHSESARRIFEQPKSTLVFDELMDSKKILLCNLSKGRLSEDITRVIGTAILTKIQLATMRRANTLEDDRVPFYLYIDEFQNFATDYFVELLSEARKYKLNIIIVEQSTAQQRDNLIINTILANVSIVICFRTASPQDEDLILPQFAPLVKKGEILNLPWFHFFIKIYTRVAQEPFTGETTQLNIKNDKEKMKRIIELSRKKYGKPYDENRVSGRQSTEGSIDPESIDEADSISGTPEENE